MKQGGGWFEDFFFKISPQTIRLMVWGVWWFGAFGALDSDRIPFHERDCCGCRAPRFESQTTGPRTTNLPLVDSMAKIPILTCAYFSNGLKPPTSHMSPENQWLESMYFLLK